MEEILKDWRHLRSTVRSLMVKKTERGSGGGIGVAVRGQEHQIISPAEPHKVSV